MELRGRAGNSDILIVPETIWLGDFRFDSLMRASGGTDSLLAWSVRHDLQNYMERRT